MDELEVEELRVDRLVVGELVIERGRRGGGEDRGDSGKEA